MGIFDKVRVPLAFQRKNRESLSSVTQTTSDWFTLRPVFSRELPPNSSISVKQSYYCRLAGLQKPFFGTGRVVNRAFFVPYSSIMEGFTDFISDTNSHFLPNAPRLSYVPYCHSSDIVQAMLQANCFTDTGADSTNYDVAIRNYNGSYMYRNFTNKGRQFYAILTGLGYSISFYNHTSPTQPNPSYDIPVSLMKLLAYCKIVADWYFNNNFYERSNSVLMMISTLARNPFNPLTQAGRESIQANLANLINRIYYSTVDNDYFSTASINPVTPTGASSVQIKDNTLVFGSDSTTLESSVVATPSEQTNGGTPVIEGVTNGSTYSSIPKNISQFVINALAATTSYMQRNNIVGHKQIDRILARFGVKIDNDLIGRSYYLGSNSSELSISEVMSNADTDGAALGSYAGRGETGLRDGKFNFENDSKSFGVFVVLSTIIPDVHYGQGISRENLRINRLDFLTPEFDSLGPQAIARAELYNDAKTPSQFEDLIAFEPDKTFGFQPTYSDYLKPQDILSGDFRRKNALDIRAFHMFRMFSEAGVEGSPNIRDYKTVSEQFVHADPSEFNKMFNYVGTDYDHFYLIHRFKFELVQPKVPLYDSYEFHDDNEGRKISMDYRGKKLN